MLQRIPSLVLTAALLAAPAYAQQAPQVPQPATQQAEAAMRQAFTSMQRDMEAMRPTGDADHDWVMMMQRHHQAAVEMSRAYEAAARDPETRRMAQKVVTDQTREIAELDEWLRRHPVTR